MYVMRQVVAEERLPPVDPRYPGNARRRLTLECGHVVERSHLTKNRARCEECEVAVKYDEYAAGGRKMPPIKTPAGIISDTLYYSLRNTWVDEHPKVHAAREALRSAESIRAPHAEDPERFVRAAVDLYERVERAKKALDDVREELKREFETRIRIREE